MATVDGILNAPLASLATLVAMSPAFRAWTGTGSYAAARDRVHLVAPPGPADGREYSVEQLRSLRPWAVVSRYRNPSNPYAVRGWEASRRGFGSTYAFGGRLLLSFEEDVDSASVGGLRDAELRFASHVGAVLADLMAMQDDDALVPAEARAAGVGTMSVQSIGEHRPPDRADETSLETQGDFIFAQYVVEFGP